MFGNVILVQYVSKIEMKNAKKKKKMQKKNTLSISPVLKLFLLFGHFEPHFSYKIVLKKKCILQYMA